MHYIGPLALIVGSLVCLSSFIIAKKPEAKQLFEKIAPYQGFLGVGLLFWGLYDLYRWFLMDHGFGGMSLFSVLMKIDKLLAFSGLAYLISEVIIGFILGFGLIASWIPGEGGAEKKGLAIQKKLLTFSLPIGIVGIISAIIVLVKFKG